MEPVAAYIPAGPVEYPPAPGREPDRVRALATGHEPDRCSGRDAQQFFQPLAGDVLECERGRRERGVEAVLVPARREPARDDRGIQRPADDEAEVARARGRHQARLRACDEVMDDLSELAWPLWKRHTECLGSCAAIELRR